MFEFAFSGRGRGDKPRFQPALVELESRLTPATFDTPFSINTPANAMSVAGGDLNGDGFTDLVVGNSGGISIVLNDGRGKFNAANTVGAGGSFPRTVAVADMDGDGNLDILAALDLEEAVSILRGTGDGKVQAPIVISVNDPTNGLTTGDFNGDGKMDAATFTKEGIQILLNDGSSNILGAPSKVNVGANVGGGGLATADFNADGKVDIAKADDVGDNIIVVLGNGDGTFGTFQVAFNLAGSGPLDVDVGDFNNDGKIDLAYTLGSNGFVGVSLGNGDGTFKAGQTTGISSRTGRLTLADFNGDNRLDIITTFSSGGTNTQVALVEGNGDGTFGPVQKVDLSTDSSDVFSADFDNDGRIDISGTSTTSPGNVTVALNTSPLIASEFTVVATPSTVNAGTAFDLTVTAVSVGGGAVTDYTGTITFSSNDPQATLPADYTFTAGDMGMVTLSGVILRTAGEQTITATDTADPFLKGTGTVTVNPLQAKNLSVTGFPPQTAPGAEQSFTVKALDEFGNVATSYSDTLTFSSSDPQAVLPPDSAIVNGIGIYSATLNTLGTQSITATSVTDPSFTDTQEGILVTTAPPPPPGVPPGVPPVPLPPGLPPLPIANPTAQNGLPFTAVGPGPGRPPEVTVYDPFGNAAYSVTAFDPAQLSGVRVAFADVTGDGVPDIIAAAGPGGRPEVRVIDGATRGLVQSFDAFESTFTGGVFVAVGDLDGDGKADIVVTPDIGGGPRVRVLNGRNAGVVIADFFGIEDPNFRGGARTGLGDINGDGRPDLVVAAGFGGGPRIAVYDGTSIATGPVKFFGDLFVFEPTLTNGVFVTLGDLDGDGKADLFASGGPGGGPRVQAFDGAELLAGSQRELVNFFAGDPAGRRGIRIVAKDFNADGKADLVTGSGSGGVSELQTFTTESLLSETPTPLASLTPFEPFFKGGVFVG